jgi:hypothetical protein
MENSIGGGQTFDCNSLQLSNGTLNVFDSVQNCWTPWNDWCTHYHYYQNYCSPTEDRMSKAFRIVKSLMDKKIVEAKTVKQFIDLVDTISKEL